MADNAITNAHATDETSVAEESRRELGRRLRFEAYEKKKHIGETAPAQSAGQCPELESGPFAIVGKEHGEGVPRKKLFGEIPRIEGDRIVLDRVVRADAEALRDLIDNPLVQRYEPAFLFEKQFDDASEAIEAMYGDLFENNESLILAIRIKETGELAGLAEFYGLRDNLHKVSIGYRLRERWWGKGLATETARLMVRYLYGETDIEIITASTMIENEASAHVLEKADFIRTARGAEEDWGHPEPTVVDKWFC